MKKLLVCLLILLFVNYGCSLKVKDVDPSYSSTMADIYQKNLDSIGFVRKGECPMHPSCSRFTKQAYANFNFFKASAISFDRLIRCGRDAKTRLKIVRVNNTLKFHDPLPVKPKEKKNEKNGLFDGISDFNSFTGTDSCQR